MLLLIALAGAIAAMLRFALWASADDPHPARATGQDLDGEDMEYFDWRG